ncbi:MAG TPA: polysaccharide biosynthesis/export family protein [Candidatus Sulfotelmatobacter sp.]|jgi:polysaccharide export outer membrane protein|nr:polysaccharide biosynthesis/export family protein [Candidatus Sulfotelmatobacter sp.]
MVPFSTLGRRRRFVFAVAASLFSLPVLVFAQQNVTVGETPQQVNDRIRTLTMGSKSSAPHDYLIGNGDLLDISVFDVPELSKEVRVSQTGTVSIPLIPVRLRVAGLTETQAEEKIAELLEANGLVSHPEVGVAVKEHRSQPITVVGAVMRPMVYQADRDVSLLEVLAEAGGIANDAGDTVIVTRRRIPAFTEVAATQPVTTTQAPGSGEPPPIDAPAPPEPAEKQSENTPKPPSFPSAEELAHATPPAKPATSEASANSADPDSTTISINLNDLLETGDTRNNIALHAGDVVTVPHAGIVYVLGAVTRPGGFVVSNDRTQLTTLKVLSLAGGLTTIAKTQQAVIIRKDDTGKQTETPVDLKKVMKRESEDITMRPSDILFIPDDRTKAALFKAAEIGLAIGTAVAVFRLAYQ